MSGQPTGATESTEMVKRAIEALRDAVNTGDTAGVYRITSDDFEVMAPGQNALSGASAREFLSGILSHFRAELKPFTNEQIIVRGDWAIQRYTYELTLTPRSGGAPMTQRGDGIHLFQRDAAGAWRLSKDVFTSVADATATA